MCAETYTDTSLSQMWVILFSVFRYIIMDTPGQIEVFTWSASGSIITESLVCIDTGRSLKTGF